MVTSNVSIGSLKIGLKGWDFIVVELEGRSSGLIMGCNKKCKIISSILIHSGIRKKLQYSQLGKFFNISNIYVLYGNRREYWEKWFELDNIRKWQYNSWRGSKFS
jgi:hypothetical protein